MSLEIRACEDGTIALSGDLSIYDAATTKAELLPWLERALERDTVRLDLSQVTELDGAGLQLLVMGKHLAAEKGRPFRLEACSAAVSRVLDLLHLDPSLDPR
jgi:anti-anti-sigma factor